MLIENETHFNILQDFTQMIIFKYLIRVRQ